MHTLFHLLLISDQKHKYKFHTTAMLFNSLQNDDPKKSSIFFKDLLPSNFSTLQ